jgi:hypothetical protein
MFYIYTDGSAIGNPGPGGWGQSSYRAGNGGNFPVPIPGQRSQRWRFSLPLKPFGPSQVDSEYCSGLTPVILLGDGRMGAGRTVVAHQFDIASFGLN